MAPLTVACVLRSGGEYKPWHVARLAEQITSTTPDARLVCLSDYPPADIPEAIVEPLEHGWEGWWSKVELFRVPWGGPVVYLDLDVTVRGDLTTFQRDELTLATDFVKPDRVNSSVMAWTQIPRDLYEKFRAAPSAYMSKYRRWPDIGDQAFIEAHANPQKFPRDMIASYRRDGLDTGAAIVAYHGQPKPWT